MKTIDFSFTGGFPLDEDGLDWLQSGYRDAIAALYFDAGSTPVIISGMKGSHATLLTPGYFAYQGEVWYCPGGSVNPVPPAPAVPLINLFDNRTPALFEDGGSNNVYIERIGAIGYGTPAANALDFGTFKTFAQVFGESARDFALSQTIALATPFGSGTATLKKDLMTGLVNMYGTMSVDTTVYADRGIGMGLLRASAAYNLYFNVTYPTW